MRKCNHLLSVLLVPAMLLQAGGSTCTGGSGSNPPSVTLPATVTGIQTFNNSSTNVTSPLYNFAVNSVSSAGVFNPGTSYEAWCTNPSALVPGGGINPNGTVTPPEDPNNPTGLATYTPVNSYTVVTSLNADYGVPGFTYDATVPGYTSTQLTLPQEWAAVNWILNNLNGVSGESPTSTDQQAAIWQLLHPNAYAGTTFGFVTATTTPGSLLTAASWALYQDALANGLSFVPAPGQVVAILLVPQTPAGSSMYQGIIVTVPLACTAGTGSATLTKTVNVGHGGASAFQLVTYTYTITNTGTLPLQNLVITDDNGTPNYSEDDVTIDIPSNVVIQPGRSYTVTSQAYLPVSLVYTSGGQTAYDTLIPQTLPVPSGSPSGTQPQLQLTYLIDSDVTDNTYGTGASAGWAGNGGHTFEQETQGWAQFALYDSIGLPVSIFNVNYLKNSGVNSLQPSGYGSTSQTIWGGSSNISYVDSTLADNLNDYQKFYTATVNSPIAGTQNWEVPSGYKVVVQQGIWGWFGMGYATINENYLAATMSGFSGQCGYPRPITYCPRIVGGSVTSTAYLCAQVCGCSSIVHAKTCLTVKLCGPSLSGCNPGGHRCQEPINCGCTCPECRAGNHGQCSAPVKCKPPACTCQCVECRAGNHGQCTHVGCTDPVCHANNCNHNTIRCVINSQRCTYTW